MFFITLLILSTSVSIVHLYPYSITDSAVSSALDWLSSQQQPDGSIGSFATSSWAVMAIAAAENDPNMWAKEGDSVAQYLKNNMGLLSSCSDYARFTLSMVAAREDPQNVNGINLVEQLGSFFDGNQFGDPEILSDDYWTVIALISSGIYKDDEKIQTTVDFIITHQDPSGGWSYDAACMWGVDVDSTSAAIMALIAAGESSSSPAIVNGLSYIKSTQDSSGGFNSGWGSSAETDSWATQAIVVAGQNPTNPEWTHSESGKNPIDDILTFQNTDGGFRDYTTSSSEWTTSYTISALLGRPYPIIRGSRIDIRLEGQSSTIWKGEVFVTWSSITDNIGADHYYQDPTVIGALDDATKQAGLTYIVDYGWDSAYVTEINGEVTAGVDGWLFRVNGHTTGAYSADTYVLNAVVPPTPPHTSVLWYYGGWEDKVTRIFLDRTTVQEGDLITVTVTYLDETSEAWLPLEGATVHADSNYVTDSSGQVNISISTGGSYMVYAEKTGYIRSDKVQVSVSQEGGEDSNLEINIIPAISLEITPSSFNFGTLGPGDTSEAFEIQLTNSGSKNAEITVTITDNESTVFKDNLHISEGSNGPWEIWTDYNESIQGHGGTRTNYIKMAIPHDYPTLFLGTNTGKITFWLEAT